jgi:hypothetical protein
MNVSRVSRRIPVSLAAFLAAVSVAAADGGSETRGAGRTDPSADESLDGTAAGPRAPAFGADKVKLGGFVASTLAYTYSDPEHWSRAVVRAQLNAEGRLGNRVKWKVGGRVDVDPVYYGSNFYLPEVKRDQQLDVFWGENYLDFEAVGWDFRLGAQNIVWGEVVGLFVADVVSARDLREFLLQSQSPPASKQPAYGEETTSLLQAQRKGPISSRSVGYSSFSSSLS